MVFLVQDDSSSSAPNGSKDPIGFEGMADTEVERRFKVIYPLINVFYRRNHKVLLV